MTRLATLASICIVFVLASACFAEVIIPLKDLAGNDSGWDVILADNVHTDVFVDAVSGSLAYVRIEIAKDFYQAPEDGVFASNIIRFQQRLDDAHTVQVIQITSEAVTNLTGCDWTDYHFAVIGDEAALNKTTTDGSGFSTDPFTVKTWGDVPAGWASNYARTLDLSGGVVAAGETFYPGSQLGRLYVDADLSGSSPAGFTLTQTPTPEPATLGLLAIGAGAVVLRRRGAGLAAA